MTKVLVTCVQMQRELPAYLDEFTALGIEVVAPPVVQQLSEDELLPLCVDVDGIIAGDDEFTERVLAAAPRLRVLSKWGIGTDGIDKPAAARLGIKVTNTPGVFGDEVADVAMGYVVLLARGLHTIDRDVRAGGWLKIEGSTLSDATLAVVGFGSIGRAVARRAAAFGMTVEAFDPLPTSRADMSMLGVRPMELDALFERADYVVLCCPLTPETYHLVDRHRLALMRSTARLVNVARGPLVDEAALVEALRGGRLGGAALDVFEVEPLPLSSPLREFDSVILGSHNGSNTAEGVRRTSRLAFDNLIAGLKAKTS